MRCHGTFRIPKVNQRSFRAALDSQLTSVLVEAARVWLTTVIMESTSAGLPIWSAASIATLSPLASYVNMSLAIAPAGSAPDRVALGLANGKATFEPGTVTPGLYLFSYETTLPHLIINEYNNANTFINPKTGTPYFHLRNPGPYRFQEKGEQAFRNFVAHVELPGWGSFLDIVTIHVG